MPNLFKHASNENIYRSLDNFFQHPGTLLFRGKELSEITSWMNSYPLDAGMRVLDLGCGEGFIGGCLFNKIDFGVDLLFEEVKKAKNFSAYKEVLLADANSLPFKDNLFDIIFSNSVVEHIKEVGRVLEEGSRVLKEGGMFIFTVPSHKFSEYLYFTTLLKKLSLSVLGLDKIYSKLRNRQLNHHNLFDDLGWERLLGRFSLKIAYRKYYLSHEDIYEWDKMCILLRISEPLLHIHRILKHRFYKKAKKLLIKNDASRLGAGLLIVARKGDDE